MSEKRRRKRKTHTTLLILGFLLLTVIVGSLSFRTPQYVLEKAAVLQCPQAEQCPVAGYPDHLRNCSPPQADNSPDEQLCNSAGRVGSCGGVDWCCPLEGAAWTTNMALCPIIPTPTPGNNCINPNINSNPWDVNQKDGVSLIDIGLIIDNFEKGSCYFPTADVNGDGIINIVDIGKVIDYYVI